MYLSMFFMGVGATQRGYIGAVSAQCYQGRSGDISRLFLWYKPADGARAGAPAGTGLSSIGGTPLRSHRTGQIENGRT